MINSNFDILAALILSGEASEKQRMEFEEILRNSKEKQIAFQKLNRVWRTDLRDKEYNYLNQRKDLWSRYQVERRSHNKWYHNSFFYKIAATVLLLLTVGVLFYISNQKVASNQELVVSVTVFKETKPGEKLKTWLPDGTVVILNSGSRLRYPENFSDSHRLVHLTGEGFFDVAEDRSRPFTVKIQSMEITALGTEFGVNAYDNNLTDQVALVSGKLLIKNNENEEVSMDSGQAVTLYREDESISMSNIDYLSQIGWKDGFLYFDNSSFDKIIQTLEMNYGVIFIQDNQLTLVRDVYTGTFKNESLENVMNVLSFSLNFKYKINGKKVIIEAN